MLQIFQYISGLLTQILKMGQAISINGFRPFWYLVGIALLTIFGSFLKGLLFSGVAGEAVSKLAGRKSSEKNNKSKNSGSRIIIINKK